MKVFCLEMVGLFLKDFGFNSLLSDINKLHLYVIHYYVVHNNTHCLKINLVFFNFTMYYKFDKISNYVTIILHLDIK